MWPSHPPLSPTHPCAGSGRGLPNKTSPLDGIWTTLEPARNEFSTRGKCSPLSKRNGGWAFILFFPLKEKKAAATFKVRRDLFFKHKERRRRAGCCFLLSVPLQPQPQNALLVFSLLLWREVFKKVTSRANLQANCLRMTTPRVGCGVGGVVGGNNHLPRPVRSAPRSRPGPTGRPTA